MNRTHTTTASHRKRCVAGVVVALAHVCGASLTASAQPQSTEQIHSKNERPSADLERARALFRRGSESARVGDFAAAAQAFEAAYALAPHETTLFNLGQAYLALEQYPDAVSTLEHYLEMVGDEGKSKEAKAQLATILPLVAHLRLTVSPLPATVVVDGAPVDPSRLNRALVLVPGVHSIEARGDAHAPASAHVELEAGTSAGITLRLPALAKSAQPIVGALSVSCAVPAMQFRLDDEPAVDVDTEPLLLEPGDHELVFVRAGYSPERRKVRIEAGKQTRAMCRPQPSGDASASGSLALASWAANANIELDGQPYRVGDPVPVGPHDVVVSGHAQSPWSSRVTVTSQEVLSLDPGGAPAEQLREIRETYQAWALGLATGAAVLAATTVTLYIDNRARYSDYHDEQTLLDELRASSSDDESLTRRQRDNDDRYDAVQFVDRLLVGTGSAAVVALIGSYLFYSTAPDEMTPQATIQLSTNSARLSWATTW